MDEKSFSEKEESLSKIPKVSPLQNEHPIPKVECSTLGIILPEYKMSNNAAVTREGRNQLTKAIEFIKKSTLSPSYLDPEEYVMPYDEYPTLYEDIKGKSFLYTEEDEKEEEKLSACDLKKFTGGPDVSSRDIFRAEGISVYTGAEGFPPRNLWLPPLHIEPEKIMRIWTEDPLHYKWNESVDEKGKITYTKNPQDKGSKHPIP